MTDISLHRFPVNIEDEMKRSYLDYAMSVIIGRALPDVRDGLKPAHRRVLYAMSQMGLASNRAYRKCAKVIGEVIGNYHPHGDQPAYDTLVRLAQDFNMRKTLAVAQGLAHVEVLRQPHQRVVGRLIAVRVVVADDFADHLGALAIRAVRRQPHLAHRVEDAAMRGLQAV